MGVEQELWNTRPIHSQPTDAAPPQVYPGTAEALEPKKLDSPLGDKFSWEIVGLCLEKPLPLQEAFETLSKKRIRQFVVANNRVDSCWLGCICLSFTGSYFLSSVSTWAVYAMCTISYDDGAPPINSVKIHLKGQAQSSLKSLDIAFLRTALPSTHIICALMV
jgi:hypothetical protein